MGKTVRMSSRVSKSLYATRRRGSNAGTQRTPTNTSRSSAGTQRTPTNSSTTRIAQTDTDVNIQTEGTTILYQRVPQNDATQSISNSSMNQDQMQQVADTVTAQLIPELRGQISHAISAMRNSPTEAVSPDLLGQSVNTGTSLNAINEVTPVTSINEQLGANVSQNLREKIINGEYVDLSSLLTNSENQEQAKSISISSNGRLVLQSKPGKKITDINVWIDAFLIYASIYTSVHTGSTQGLLKYMFTVKLGANRSNGQGWREYDQQFRLKKAKNPVLP